MIGGLILLALFALTQGAVPVPLSHVARIFLGRTAEIRDSHVFIVQEVRLPRIIVASLVGGILSLIGAVFQAIFRNPMADPFVMGVSSGAAFGATVAIVFGGAAISAFAVLGLGMVSLSAFVGAVLSVLIVYTLASHRGRVSVTGILLAGVVMSAVLSAFISFLMILSRDDTDKIVRWTMGSFNGANWDYALLLAVPAVAGGAYLLSLARELNAMSLSEREARGMGVDVDAVKRGGLLVSSLLAAVAVSASGIIGFVGLIVPHFFRMIVGSNHRILLPVSFLGGALFLLGCDTFARSFVLGMEIPVGIVTSVVGGPFFLVLLQKHKKRML